MPVVDAPAMTAEERFQFQLTDPRHADVASQLYMLRRYAACANTIVELGTDDCSTTVAFLLGRPERLYSFDLWKQKEVKDAYKWAEELGVQYEFAVGDSRTIRIPECDLCYIDTDHSAESTLIELKNHAPRVRDTILMHDTTACGDYAPDLKDYNGPWIPPGIWTGSIGPFLRSDAGKKWRLQWVSLEGTGLTCLQRR